MRVAVVTCTRERPELLALAKRWVQRQTRLPDLHLIRDEPEPVFTNLTNALSAVPAGHHVVIMEDDDWYAPNHVETLVDALEAGPMLAASRDVRRVNLPARKSQLAHSLTPGPGMVGIHAEYVARYAELVAESLRGDRIAWEETGLVPSAPPTTVGIKGVGYGLPGISGSTKKHDPCSSIVRKWDDDPEWRQFRAWLGDDAEAYLGLLR